MSFKGYASSRKPDGSEVDFATVEPIRTEQHGISVLAHSFMRSVVSDAAEAGSESGKIVATAHVAKKGDVINVTSGVFAGSEAKVIRTETNNIYIADAITLAATDTFEILRHKYPKVAADGGIGVTITPSPILFTLDGNDQEVTYDTADNNNTFPLPTQLFDTNNDAINPATEGSVNNVTAAVTSFQSDFNDFYNDFTTEDFASETTLAALLAELQLKADLTDTQPVSAASLPLPTGAATSALQSAGNTSLGNIDTKLPATLGQKTMANSLAVVLASDQTMNLPTGASTEAKQDDIITGLNDIFAELQQKTEPTDTQPVSAAALPLPTGASTSALQTTGNTSLGSIDGKLPATLGQKAMAASLAVVIASDQTAVPVSQSGNWSVRAQDGSGNALSSQAVGSNRALHTKDLGGSLADSAVKASGTVTSGAWVELIASTAAESQGLTVFDSSGVSVEIGLGAAASEVRALVVPPGGLNGIIPLRIPAGSRVSIRAISTTADYASAEHILNLIG